MEDVNNQSAGAQDAAGTEVENKAAADSGQSKENNGAASAGNDDKSSQKSSEDQKATPPTKEEEDQGPPVRKSKLDYILERKERKIQKLQSQKPPENQGTTPPPPKPAGENEESEGDEGDDDISPEEAAKFKKFVEREYGTSLKKAEHYGTTAVENEIKQHVSEFLNTDEGKYFKDVEAKIVRWAKDPSRKDIPIKAIAMEIVGMKRIMQIGAEMEKEASEKAKSSQAGGGSGRSGDGGSQNKDWLTATPQEILAEQQKVMQRR